MTAGRVEELAVMPGGEHVHRAGLDAAGRRRAPESRRDADAVGQQRRRTEAFERAPVAAPPDHVQQVAIRARREQLNLLIGSGTGCQLPSDWHREIRAGRVRNGNGK